MFVWKQKFVFASCVFQHNQIYSLPVNFPFFQVLNCQTLWFTIQYIIYLIFYIVDIYITVQRQRPHSKTNECLYDIQQETSTLGSPAPPQPGQQDCQQNPGGVVVRPGANRKAEVQWPGQSSMRLWLDAKNWFIFTRSLKKRPLNYTHAFTMILLCFFSFLLEISIYIHVWFSIISFNFFI